MEADDRISYVGEDLEVKTAPKGYPKGRVRDTPISEAAIVGLGIGAALAEERPVVRHHVSRFFDYCHGSDRKSGG